VLRGGVGTSLDGQAFAFVEAGEVSMRRPPDFVIGGLENPYLLRWWLIPRNRWFNVYLHQMLRDDDPRALHDHPWVNVSIVLKGGYWEHRKDQWPVWRGPGAVVLRRAIVAHRLTLAPGAGPSWSLFLTGPNVREWGFHCPKGWRHWKDFCAPGDSGRVGRGCE
jgi:hypothetical protein